MSTASIPAGTQRTSFLASHAPHRQHVIHRYVVMSRLVLSKLIVLTSKGPFHHTIDPLPVASSSRLERADLLIEFLYSEEDPGRVQSYLAELVAGAQGPTAEAARLIHQDVPATFLGENMNALSTAAELGGAAILKFFLAQPGVRPDVPDGCGYTPLFYAARVSVICSVE